MTRPASDATLTTGTAAVEDPMPTVAPADRTVPLRDAAVLTAARTLLADEGTTVEAASEHQVETAFTTAGRLVDAILDHLHQFTDLIGDTGDLHP